MEKCSRSNCPRVVSVLIGIAVLASSAVWPAASAVAGSGVVITQPSGGSTVAGEVTVKASVDATATRSNLLVDGSVVATKTTYAGPVGGPFEVTFQWDSESVENTTHQLEVAATDEKANNDTSAPVSVTVDNFLTNPYATQVTFSPDKDGRDDITKIVCTLTAEATLTVQVKNPSGDVIATLASDEPTTAGKKTFTWTGLRDDKYPDFYNNWYSVEVKGTRNGLTITKTVDVRILCTKAYAKVWPSARSFTPDGDGSGDTVLVNVRLYKYSYMTVGIYSAAGKLVKTLRPWSLSNSRLYRWRWNGRWNSGAKARPGLYVIKAITRNPAGPRLTRDWTRIRGVRWLLLIKDEIRLYFLEGREPVVGPPWADWTYGGVKAAVFPLGIGMPGWETPSGHTFVEAKRVWPTWYPPPWAGIGHPVGPGRNNPLGPRAMNLSPRGYETGIRIHGTNNMYSIGGRVSHGCIRMYPKDVIWLFARVPIGTKVWVTQHHPKGYPLVGPRQPSPGRRRWY